MQLTEKKKEAFTVIEINNLVKKYGDHVAVDDLSLTVEPGKIYGFLGPNGAGKSTTMDMIFSKNPKRQKNVLVICRKFHLCMWI